MSTPQPGPSSAHRPATDPTYVVAGHRVDRVGFGTMRLHAVPPQYTDAVPVLRRAVDLGVDHIDTSGFYGPGTANEAVRTALDPYPEDLLIVTKVGWTPQFSPAFAPQQLREAVELNRRTLGLDTLPMVNLRLDDRLHARPESIDEPLGVLQAEQEAGRIGRIGISHAPPPSMCAAPAPSPTSPACRTSTTSRPLAMTP
ncbi:aldo/keto reductase [Brachybacterium sp. EF45031]|uniref:aldo/keto reductase n=1 Tax=Brachybacterium sillae TaxID=2810536 RepID=UPI00217D2159|nr:aldo/keto reductase [Brachybacterium sillae]MCS6711813.1 aldo/keto reductase [Brachybacterium sillae]